MFRNYLKIAFRTLWKHKSHTAINVLGLAVASASAALLFMTALFQLSFDQFHADVDQLHQVYTVINNPDRVERRGSMPYPLAPTLKAEFPELEGVTRYQQGQAAVQYGDQQLAKEIDHVDPDMLTIFSFPLRQGNPRMALNDLSSIVITENMAADVFGKTDPIGKTLRINNNGSWRTATVTGVLADFPDNSSIHADAFMRIENSPGYANSKDRWDNTNHAVYVKCKPGVSQATLEQRMRAFTAKYFQYAIRDLKQQGAKPDERGELISTRVIRLTDARFESELNGGKGAPRAAIYAIALIGVFILLIATINFINLTLARSFGRAREMGVRKTMGARPGQLFGQLWGETALVCGLGLVLGVALALGLESPLNALFGFKLHLSSLGSLTTAGIVLTMFLVVTLVAGGYPALVVARFGTVQALTGKMPVGRQNGLRNSLIVVQFTIASLLIVSTLIVVQQNRYLRQIPLGFQKEQVISIPVGNEVRGNDALQRLRNQLRQNPNVLSITGTGVNIGRGRDNSSSRSMIGFLHKDHEVTADWLRVDYDYLTTLGIKLREGRDFSRQYATDSTTAVVVSESFVKQLGEKRPVGSYFQTDSAGVKYEVVGVVPDFHLYSLRNKIEPIVMHLHQDADINYIFVRVTPQSMTSIMETLRREWRQIAPKSEFLASFMDENTDKWYKQDEGLAQLLTLAAGIAILLSCTGLFAIALISIQQRTKEIGVRKVLGASVVSIVALLSRDFLKLVVIGILIASPVAWYAISQWLKGFAYKVDIEWWVFAIAGVLAVGVALLTVSFQSIKAALMNPVKSLRTE